MRENFMTFYNFKLWYPEVNFVADCVTVIEPLFARPHRERPSRPSLCSAAEYPNFNFVKFEISLILFLEGLPLVNDYFERKEND
tara:strand:- start:1147 stop:1398 length:252 start_codon:yes stop_codon:yes gene_type:complete